MQFWFHCIRFLLLPYTYVLLHYLDSQIVPQGYSSIVAFEYFSGILFFEEHILFCTIFQMFCNRTDGNYYLKLSYPYKNISFIVWSTLSVHEFWKIMLKTQVQWTGFLACKNQFRDWFFQATQAVTIQFEID